MAVDPSIALGGKPLQLENPLNAFAQMSQIQAYQRQNELANRAVEQEDALNRAYAGAYNAETGEIDANKLRSNVAGANIGSKLPAIEKTLLEGRKLKTEVGKGELELGIAQADKSIRDIAGYNTRADALRHIEQDLAAKKISPQQAQQFAGMLPADDAGMPQFQLQMLRRALSAKDQLEQHFVTQDTGGGARVLGMPKYGGGPAQVVQGSQVAKTMSPSDKIAQAREDRLAAGSDLKPVPVHAQKAITGAASALGKIDAAIAALEANPNAVGWKGLTPDIALNRMDPEGTVARAKLADIGSLKIHERSGAAVTASETPRLKPFIPSISDDYDTALKKLKDMREIQAAEQEVLTGTYNRDQGFRDFSAPQPTGKAPAAPAEKPAAPAAATNVVTLPNGSSMTFPNAKAAAEFKKKAGL